MGFSLVFYFCFFQDSTWYHLQCDYFDLNVKFLTSFKKFYKFRGVEVLSKDLYQQKKF
jgi:hypothetical protein